MAPSNPNFSTGTNQNPGTIRQGYHINSDTQTTRELEFIRELATNPEPSRALEIYRVLHTIAPERW